MTRVFRAGSPHNKLENYLRAVGVRDVQIRDTIDNAINYRRIITDFAIAGKHSRIKEIRSACVYA